MTDVLTILYMLYNTFLTLWVPGLISVFRYGVGPFNIITY